MLDLLSSSSRLMNNIIFSKVTRFVIVVNFKVSNGLSISVLPLEVGVKSYQDGYIVEVMEIRT